MNPLRLYITYDRPADQVQAMRLQALIVGTGIEAYVPPVGTHHVHVLPFMESGLDKRSLEILDQADALIALNPLDPCGAALSFERDHTRARAAIYVVDRVSCRGPNRCRLSKEHRKAIRALGRIGQGLLLLGDAIESCKAARSEA